MEFKYNQSGSMSFEDILGQNIPLLLVGCLPLGLPQIASIMLKGKDGGT